MAIFVTDGRYTAGKVRLSYILKAHHSAARSGPYRIAMNHLDDLPISVKSKQQQKKSNKQSDLIV